MWKSYWALLLVIASILLLSCSSETAMQNTPQTIVNPEATALILGKNPTVHNRQIEALPDGGIGLSEAEGDGIAYLPDVNFGNGVIEFDVKGRNVPQRSFVGLAFHGVDTETYDVVYFRPFNFHAEAEERRNHSVQYISHPTYTWFKLREENPGIYENSIDSPPEPDDWFHVRVVIDTPRVQVFLENSQQASLTVDQLSDRGNGWIGFWVGNGSDGYFSNLKLNPTP